ncbi:MAG: tetratricopeptide repeat protein [Victivallales bacterium]|nr:tetratricopeptide repeat protein [Victivallales bacterium]
MQNTFRIFLLVSLLFMTLSIGAAPSDPARRIWLGGYEAMTLAEQEEKDHADLAALRHYEQALEIFEQVHHDYPDWNVTIITFRIDYCRQKIANIKEQNRQNTAFLSREDLIAQLASDNAELQTCRERITVLETQLREMRDQLQLARAEAAAQTANEENIRILRGDREVLTAQVQRLTAELAAAQEDLRKNATLAQNLAEAQELERQLSVVRTELEQTGRLLEQTATARDALLQQTQREAQWHTMAIEQIDALRQQLATAQQSAQDWQRQAADLRQQVTDLQTTLQQQKKDPTLLAAISDEQAAAEQLRAKLGAIEAELQGAQMEVLNLRRRLMQSEETAATQLQELTDLRRRAAATNQAYAEQRQSAEATQLKNQQLGARNEELQQTVDSQRELLGKMEATAAQNEQHLKEAEARISALQDRITALQAQLDAATKASEGISANAQDTEAELSRCQAEIAALKEKTEQTSQALATAQVTVQTQKERIDELMQSTQAEEAVKAAERVWMAQLQELRSQLEESTRKQHDLEIALIRRENEKNALAEALRAQEEATATANAAAAKAEAESLLTPAVPAIEEVASQPATLLSRQDAIILRAYIRQGVDAERAGKNESAQWNYEQALAIQPENPTALKRLGVLAYGRNDFSEASKYLTAAFRLNPDDHDILLALGFTMLQLNQPQWALAYLSRAVALKPQDFQTTKLFGNALSTLQWRDAAIRQLTRALELQPTDGETAMTLAMLQMTLASETDLASQRDPVHQEALRRLAAAQRKKALEWYRRAVANGAQPDPRLEEDLSHN